MNADDVTQGTPRSKCTLHLQESNRIISSNASFILRGMNNYYETPPTPRRGIKYNEVCCMAKNQSLPSY